MAVDRDTLRHELDKQRARRAAVNIKYLPKGKATNLRFLEFQDDEGNSRFSRTLVQFRMGDGKKTMINRQATLGAPCAAARLDELASQKGDDSPFLRQQTVHLVNAINMDEKPHKVEIYQLPVSLWEQIAEFLVSDEWEDVLEPEDGHPFTCTREGSGLETEYSAVVARKAFPVSEDLLAQVKDPLEVIEDPGLEGQCEALGVNMEDLFENPDELEDIEPVNREEKKTSKPKAKTPAKTSKKKTSKKTSSKKSPFGVGIPVEGEIDGEWYPGTISGQTDDGWTVTFDDGDEMDLEESSLRLNEAPDEEEEEEEEEAYVPKTGDPGKGEFEDGDWYPGVIKKVNKNGTIRVKFGDGDEATLDLATQWKPDEEDDDIPFEEPPLIPKGGKRGAAAAAASVT